MAQLIKRSPIRNNSLNINILPVPTRLKVNMKGSPFIFECTKTRAISARKKPPRHQLSINLCTAYQSSFSQSTSLDRFANQG